MSLAAGSLLGPYKVVAALGAGGMGEVYRALDTRLQREIALKVLPDAFAKDAQRVAGFQREAQLLAALNHPNIAAIYGIHDCALIMELVEGQTLAERIERGPIPSEEAIPMIRQIAQALEAAHEKGIIHRDLKPANIKITPDGMVKVLDFGLARIADPAEAPNSDGLSATLTIPPPDPSGQSSTPLARTRLGALVGTAFYMSPEQARGEKLDKRTDVWSFGVVVYEMVTGRVPFDGKSLPEALAGILKSEPDYEAVPPPFRRLVRHCLQKDRKRRLRDLGDARLALEDGTDDAPAAPRRRQRAPWLLAGALVAAAMAGGFLAPWHSASPDELPLLSFNEPAGPELVLSSGRGLVLSSDGSRIVYVSRGPGDKRYLTTRRLSQLAAVTLPGSEGAMYPFLSPDGQWVGFFAGGKLKKISVDGGAALTLCDAPNGRGGAWGPDNTIIAALNNRGALFRIPLSGGAVRPEPLTTLNQEENSHRWPHFVPGTRVFVFTAGSAGGGTLVNTHVEAQSLETGQRKTLRQGGLFARALATGHVVWLEDGNLVAAPLDPRGLKLTASPLPVLEDVVYDTGTAEAMIGFSETGAVAYLRGRGARPSFAVQWLDRSGRKESAYEKPGDYSGLRLSPDGKRLAITITEGGNSQIWVHESNPEKMTRLTFAAGLQESPVWSPGGDYIAFRGGTGIFRVRVDGGGGVQPLTESKNSQYPQSFSPDGRKLVYEELSPETGLDIWMLDLGPDPAHPTLGKPQPIANTRFMEASPAVSPDGRWLAYSSDESGKNEIYVRPFSGPAGKWQISSAEGAYPVWSPGGRELFYRSPAYRIMAARYAVKGDSFAAEEPYLWSPEPLDAIGFTRSFDVAPDGKRFVILRTPTEATVEKKSAQVLFLLNFFDEIKRRKRNGGKPAP